MQHSIQKQIRFYCWFFMISLVLSGATAIFIEEGLAFFAGCFPLGSRIGDWLETVYSATQDTNAKYPFLTYGNDWLAFAHFVLAILFIGPLRDPVRNKWIIEFGIICCLLVIPYAMIMGAVRHIPFWWRLIDCPFGIVGIVPLIACSRLIKKIEQSNTINNYHGNIDTERGSIYLGQK